MRAPKPPWLKFPEIPRCSIGWRMGEGEGHMFEWSDWARDQTHEQLIAYFRQYAPLPLEWVDWVGIQMTPNLPDEHMCRVAGESIAELDLFDVEKWRAYAAENHL